MGPKMQAVMKFAVAGVVATSAPLMFAGTASAHGACRAPAEVERVSQLRAGSRTSCTTARSVAAAYDEKVMAGGSFPDRQPLRVRGFRCTTTPAGPSEEETFKVRCLFRKMVVRFMWGV